MYITLLKREFCPLASTLLQCVAHTVTTRRLHNVYTMICNPRPAATCQLCIYSKNFTI